MNKVLPVLLLLFAFTSLKAQRSMPPTPIWNWCLGECIYIRVDCDSVHSLSYNHYEVFSDWGVRWYHSEDGLTDYSAHYEYSYYPDGKLKYFIYENESKESYIYDKEGRLSRIVRGDYGYASFNYDNSQLVILEHWNEKGVDRQKTIIKKTSYGYQEEVYDYIFDLGRFTTTPFINEYHFDSSGKMIKRVSDYTDRKEVRDIEYGENYYTTTSKRKKEYYEFNDEGYLIKESHYDYMTSPEPHWSLNFTNEYSYFKLENSIVSNENIVQSHIDVYVTGSTIKINSNPGLKIHLYSIMGGLVKGMNSEAGVTQISVPSGIYIVSVNNQSFKVMVR